MVLSIVLQTGKVNKQFEKVLMNGIHELEILVIHKEMLDYFNTISKIEFVHILMLYLLQQVNQHLLLVLINHQHQILTNQHHQHFHFVTKLIMIQVCIHFYLDNAHLMQQLSEVSNNLMLMYNEEYIDLGIIHKLMFIHLYKTKYNLTKICKFNTNINTFCINKKTPKLFGTFL